METGLKEEFMHRMGRVGKQWGMGAPAGRIWGLLLFENHPLTQKEIAKHTKYSLSSVSPTLKVLERIGVVSIVGKKGKEYMYSAAGSIADSFRKSLHHLMEFELKPLTNLLSSNLGKMKEKGAKKRVESLIKSNKELVAVLRQFSNKLAKRGEAYG